MRQVLNQILTELHLDSGSTTGLAFLPSYVIISLLLLWARERRLKASGRAQGGSLPEARTGLLAQLFPKEGYAHPSSLIDLKLLSMNALVAGAAGLLGLGSGFRFMGMLGKLQHGSQDWISGLLPLPAPTGAVFSVSGLWINLLFTVSLAVAHDFGRVVVHYAMHKIPSLWEIHKYHHNAETLTPFTTYRFHPTEMALTSLSVGLSIGVCIRAFQLLFGTERLSMVMVFGMSVVTIATHLLGVFEHGNKWFSLGRLGYLFASPANHLVHHSIEPRHRDKNFANHFAIFDLILGTLYIPKEEEHFRIGVVQPDGSPLITRSLFRQFYIDPLLDGARTALGLMKQPAQAASEPQARDAWTRCWCGPKCPVLSAAPGNEPAPVPAWTRVSDLFDSTGVLAGLQGGRLSELPDKGGASREAGG